MPHGEEGEDVAKPLGMAGGAELEVQSVGSEDEPTTVAPYGWKVVLPTTAADAFGQQSDAARPQSASGGWPRPQSASGGWPRESDAAPGEAAGGGALGSTARAWMTSAALRPSTVGCSTGGCLDGCGPTKQRWRVQQRPVTRDTVRDQLLSSASKFFRGQGLGYQEERREATFLCLVCFENQPMERRLHIHACQIPGHSCCIDCAGTYFHGRIEQGRVFELYCPIGAAEGNCSSAESSTDFDPEHPLKPATAARDEVARCLLGDEASLQKYDRFVRSKLDSTLRECPECRVENRPRLNSEGRPLAEMECSACGFHFCYFHNAAHRNSSCDEYEVLLAAETRGITEAFGTKDCPKCQRQSLKSGGCNHMTCHVCRCDWCWICGQELLERGPHGEDRAYWHYSDENADSGCQQFAEAGTHPDAETVRLWRRDLRPTPAMRHLVAPVRLLAVALLIASAMLAMVLWLLLFWIAAAGASFLGCLSRQCGRALNLKIPESLAGPVAQRLVKPTFDVAAAVGTFVFLLPFSAISFAWAIVGTLLWALLLCLALIPGVRLLTPAITRRHLRYFVFAPQRAVHQFGSSTFALLTELDHRAERVDPGMALADADEPIV